MSDEIIINCQAEMESKIVHLEKNFSHLRTGKASITILDGIKCEYYGTPTPLNQIASLSTPDPRTIVISPFEKKLAHPIEKAIMVANLGLTPINDGNVIRIPIPALTQERRLGLVKRLKEMGEESKIVLRQVRRNWNEQIKKSEKNKKISEDESQKFQKEIQQITDTSVKKVDEKLHKKEKDILTI